MTTLEDHDVDPLDVDFAPGWTEEPGDKLRGKLISRDERDAGFGPYPIYTIELAPGHTARTANGEMGAGGLVAVHASRDVLRRKLANARLELDAEVGIKYQGPPQGTAKSYRYRVVKYLSDGSYDEVAYDADDAPAEGTVAAERAATRTPDRVSEDEEAASQLALEREREARDQAVSEAEAARMLHTPIGEGEVAA